MLSSRENLAARVEALEDVVAVLMAVLARTSPQLRKNILDKLEESVEDALEREESAVSEAIDIIRASFKGET